MTHEEFKKKWIGKWFEESRAIGFQCVAWVKQYSREVFEVVLGSFWGSAVSGRHNTKKTFDNKRNKIVYKEWILPQVWDMIFYGATPKNEYWHVGIVDSITGTGIMILEQNGWWPWWHGVGDEYTIRSRTYKNCLWRLRFVKAPVKRKINRSTKLKWEF